MMAGELKLHNACAVVCTKNALKKVTLAHAHKETLTGIILVDIEGRVCTYYLVLAQGPPPQ